MCEGRAGQACTYCRSKKQQCEFSTNTRAAAAKRTKTLKRGGKIFVYPSPGQPPFTKSPSSPASPLPDVRLTKQRNRPRSSVETATVAGLSNREPSPGVPRPKPKKDQVTKHVNIEDRRELEISRLKLYVAEMEKKQENEAQRRQAVGNLSQLCCLALQCMHQMHNGNLGIADPMVDELKKMIGQLDADIAAVHRGQ